MMQSSYAAFLYFIVIILVSHLTVLGNPLLRGDRISSTSGNNHEANDDLSSPYEETHPHHVEANARKRVKRQLGEIAFQLNHLLEFLVTAASQSFQQLGRMGQDLVGRNDGGLLALLESLFVGVEVSGDFVRNFLNSLLGTLNTALGTPTEENEELNKEKTGEKRPALTTDKHTSSAASTSSGTNVKPSSGSNDPSGDRASTRPRQAATAVAPRRDSGNSQRRRKNAIEVLRDSPSLGKRLQAELRELGIVQRQLWAAANRQMRWTPINNARRNMPLENRTS